MSLIGDVGKGIGAVIGGLVIAPLPVSLVVWGFFGGWYAVLAHLFFMGSVFADNSSSLREAKVETASDHISLLLRYYCACFVAIALYFGSSAAFDLLASTNSSLKSITGIGPFVVGAVGLLICGGLFGSRKAVSLTPPISPEPIRGTHVKGGDDLPTYLPPPPGGIGE